jgi:DNA-binding transcriptional ArsR family regulator
MPGKDKEPPEWKVRRALDHPVRLRILELHRRDSDRSPLSVAKLTAALRDTGDYREVTAAQVNYHRALLRDADLLPRGGS